MQTGTLPQIRSLPKGRLTAFPNTQSRFVPLDSLQLSGGPDVYLVGKYAFFALIAMLLNLGTQALTSTIYSGPLSLYVAMVAGTILGLATKFYLDREFVFYHSNSCARRNATSFMLYCMMGTLTTLVFWGTEILFHELFESSLSKYFGASIGLSVGYTLKYYLDLKFVFRKPETTNSVGHAIKNDEGRPLVVDLDGTLLRTDLLWESLIHYVRLHPLLAWKPFTWALQGKSAFKSKLADAVRPDVNVLPYNTAVMQFLIDSHRRGRRLILASGSDERLVHDIADHLGMFSDVLGTARGTNLVGNRKLGKIRALLGNKPFDYIGNGRQDLPLWAASQRAYVVSENSHFRKRIASEGGEVFVLLESKQGWAALRELRPHQWVKNMLLFVPLILAREFESFTTLLTLVGAFVAFSFCASAIYVINDLCDISADRHHHSKRLRPLASGDLSIPAGIVLSLLCGGVGLALSACLLPWAFSATLLGYIICTFLYSFKLKREPIVDVLGLSLLYGVRIIAGSTASGIPTTPWLLAFSTFFFLSLAFAKRYVELAQVSTGQGEIKRRGYRKEDLVGVLVSGMASGYLSVLVFFVYIAESDAVQRFYPSSPFLWLIGPLLIYWQNRIWFLAQRNQLHSDPVSFAIRDRMSWAIGLLALGVLLISGTEVLSQV